MKTCKNWIVILLLIVFFPVGLYLMWAKTGWKKNVKIVVTIFIAGLFIISASQNTKIDNKSNANSTTSVVGVTAETTTEEITTEESTTIVPTTEKTTEKNTEKTTEQTTEKVSQSSVENENSNNNFQTYNNEEQQNTTEYVLNTSTKKVHLPTCSAVKKISSENYATISSLKDAYSQGYEACKICNP